MFLGAAERGEARLFLIENVPLLPCRAIRSERALKSMPRPRQSKLTRVAQLLEDPLVEKAVAMLLAHQKNLDEPMPELWRFDDAMQSAIQLLAERQKEQPVDEKAFVAAMERTRPLIAQPRVTDPAADLWLMLSLPEVLEMWSRWPTRTGERGRHPGYFTKAFLLTMAGIGLASDYKRAYQQFEKDSQFAAVFQLVEEKVAASLDRPPEPFGRKSYERTLTQVRLMADPKSAGVDLMDLCIETNLKLVRSLYELHGVNEARAAIDGNLVEAQVRQVGKRSPEEEAYIRRNAPNAGPRAHVRDGELTNFVRGYDLVPLASLEFGLPFVWTTIGADHREEMALKGLLFRLFEQWPSCALTTIVADSKWDQDWASRWCLQNYGVHMVAVRQEHLLDVRHELNKFDNPHISHFLGDGTAFCRYHQVPLAYKSAELRHQDRSGVLLMPGEPTPELALRLRYLCPLCGDKPKSGIHVAEGWAALSYFPHAMRVGRPDLHAERIALFGRRNAIESLFSALQRRHKQGLEGSGKNGSPHEHALNLRLSIALLMRTALAVADQRIVHGLIPNEPPPELRSRLGLN
jgi:hypothetical protein